MAQPFGSQIFGWVLEDDIGTSVVGGPVVIENNLFGSGGWIGDHFGGAGVTYRHNTFINGNVPWLNGRLLNISYSPIIGFAFNDNIAFNNEYGMNQQPTIAGTNLLPGLIMTGNVLISRTLDPNRPNCSNTYNLFGNNFCPTSISQVGFANPLGGDYSLLTSSPYHNKASDGTDPGVNMGLLNQEMSGANSMPSPSPSPLPTPSPSPPAGIQVLSGTYGGNVGAAPGNATADLAAACNGKQQCIYTIDYHVIGDPMPGQQKDYVATWRCDSCAPIFSASVPAEAGLGSQVTLSCGAPPMPSPSPSSGCTWTVITSTPTEYHVKCQ